MIANACKLVLMLLMAIAPEVKAQEASAAPEVNAPVASTQDLLNEITLSDQVFVIEGKTFTASPTNTVDRTLSELEEGDKVTIEFPDSETSDQSINVLRIEKIE